MCTQCSYTYGSPNLMRVGLSLFLAGLSCILATIILQESPSMTDDVTQSGMNIAPKHGKLKAHVVVDLPDEAKTLHPIISYCHELNQSGKLSGYDLVGVYILSYLAMRRKNSWSNGRLKEQIISNSHFNSTPISNLCYPQFNELISISYLAKKLNISVEQAESLTVMDIFNTMQLSGVKHNTDNYINRCIVMWAAGQRPVRLLFHIPTPMEVLRQQAEGERVVTMFTTLAELSTTHKAKLAYMRGMIDHCKDPLEFLVHDMKHMENFVEGDIYREQVGFFKCILALNSGKPRSYFLSSAPRGFGYDLELWTELEYVISDMNCYSTHLLRYLYAKMFSATRRKVEQHEVTTTAATVEESVTGSLEEVHVSEITTKTSIDCDTITTPLTASTNTTTNTTNTTNITTTSPADILMTHNWHLLLIALGMIPITIIKQGDGRGVGCSEGDYSEFMMRYRTKSENDVISDDGILSDNMKSLCIENDMAKTISTTSNNALSPTPLCINTTVQTTTHTTTEQQSQPSLHHHNYSAHLSHLAYHAGMALIAVSIRTRSEWSENEAESVRMFFEGKSK